MRVCRNKRPNNVQSLEESSSSKTAEPNWTWDLFQPELKTRAATFLPSSENQRRSNQAVSLPQAGFSSSLLQLAGETVRKKKRKQKSVWRWRSECRDAGSSSSSRSSSYSGSGCGSGWLLNFNQHETCQHFLWQRVPLEEPDPSSKKKQLVNEILMNPSVEKSLWAESRRKKTKQLQTSPRLFFRAFSNCRRNLLELYCFNFTGSDFQKSSAKGVSQPGDVFNTRTTVRHLILSLLPVSTVSVLTRMLRLLRLWQARGHKSL